MAEECGRHLHQAVEVDQVAGGQFLAQGQPALTVLTQPGDQLAAVPVGSGQLGRDLEPGRLVRDPEPRGKPGRLVVLAQDPQAQAVERGHRGLVGPARAQCGQPVLYLLRRPPGERDRQEVPGRQAAVHDLVGDAVGERPGLAGSRAGDDQQRPVGARRGPLVWIKRVEQRARRGRRPGRRRHGSSHRRAAWAGSGPGGGASWPGPFG